MDDDRDDDGTRHRNAKRHLEAICDLPDIAEAPHIPYSGMGHGKYQCVRCGSRVAQWQAEEGCPHCGARDTVEDPFTAEDMQYGFND